MTFRCLLSKKEVVAALVKAALAKRDDPLPSGVHSSVATVLMTYDEDQGLQQARVEIEMPGVPV